jgi:hypothetical protein
VDTAPVDSQNPQSINRYTYALNNPNVYIDPTGLAGLPSGDPHYLTQKQEEELESECDYETNYHVPNREAEELVNNGISLPSGATPCCDLSKWAAAGLEALAVARAVAAPSSLPGNIPPDVQLLEQTNPNASPDVQLTESGIGLGVVGGTGSVTTESASAVRFSVGLHGVPAPTPVDFSSLLPMKVSTFSRFGYVSQTPESCFSGAEAAYLGLGLGVAYAFCGGILGYYGGEAAAAWAFAMATAFFTVAVSLGKYPTTCSD